MLFSLSCSLLISCSPLVPSLRTSFHIHLVLQPSGAQHDFWAVHPNAQSAGPHPQLRPLTTDSPRVLFRLASGSSNVGPRPGQELTVSGCVVFLFTEVPSLEEVPPPFHKVFSLKPSPQYFALHLPLDQFCHNYQAKHQQHESHVSREKQALFRGLVLP